MENSILYGICKKCGIAMVWDEEPGSHHTYFLSHNANRKDFTPLLSAKQMGKLWVAEEYRTFCKKQHRHINAITSVAAFLEREPFLIAKILKGVQK